MIEADATSLRRRAGRLAKRLREAGYSTEIVEDGSITGGGSLPGHAIPTPVVRAVHPDLRSKAIAAAARTGDPAVVVRVERDAVVVDLRTVPAADDRTVAEALRTAVED
jgi:L-seryl-tRNA(Ser) seleniumtransferase